MKTLLTSTALTLALAMSASAVASATVTQTDTVYQIEVSLTAPLPAALTLNDRDFYRGDFLSASQSKLRSLTAMDLYTGMGAARVSTTRDVTDF